VHACGRCCHGGLASRYIAYHRRVRERDATLELRGRAAVLAISLVSVSLVGGSLWGWSVAGPLGGLLGVLIGTAIGALAFTIVRASASSGVLDGRAAPDVRELPPDQAMQVLTALMRASVGEGGGSVSLEGGLLSEIGKARGRAESGDLDGALHELQVLAQRHPHAPAIPAELARLLAGDPSRTDEHTRAARKAIVLAIRGGGAQLAVQVYERLEDTERERLELDDATASQLAKIFAARGDDATASRLRVRSRP
jgi:hypothetical protein